MIIFATQQLDVQIEATLLGEGLKEVRHHLGAERTQRRTVEREINARVGAAPQIDGDQAEGIIERYDGVPEPSDRASFAERLMRLMTSSGM